MALPPELDPRKCGVVSAPRKTTTVPKLLRVGRKGKARTAAWRNRGKS